MKPQTPSLGNWPDSADRTKIFRQIHEKTYEMTALATNSEAKLLGYLLMMVALEAERLSQSADANDLAAPTAQVMNAETRSR